MNGANCLRAHLSRSPICSAFNTLRSTSEHKCILRPLSSASMRHLSTTSANRKSATPGANPFVLSTGEDFEQTNASRPPFDPNLPVITTRSPIPSWKYGDGANVDVLGRHRGHVEIDPNTRPFVQNYRLLMSAIPRPISFVSTLSKDGKQKNLAPFSYFQVVDHDPPIFVIGFSARPGRMKDTRRNLLETGECVISIVSERMIEGVNATSLDVPYGTSEWDLAGFKGEKSSSVKPERVAEAVFSIEGKLLEMKELNYHDEAQSGKPTGALAIIEGTRFWVDKNACNEAGDAVDLNASRPLVGLGGISYGRVRETFEWPRGYLPAELEKTENGLAHILAKGQQGRDS